MKRLSICLLFQLTLTSLLPTLNAQPEKRSSGSTFGQADDSKGALSRSFSSSEIVDRAKEKVSPDSEALRVGEIEGGVELRCDFQRLIGTVDSEGLKLTSTSDDCGGIFQVRAVALGRDSGAVNNLPSSGLSNIQGESASYWRPGLKEEYFTSMDGLRQDFVVSQRQPGAGNLRVELAVSGARVVSTDFGVRLILDASEREIAYSRLHVADSRGRVLKAEMKAEDNKILVIVDDEDASYPVRIDPTFSDENWLAFAPGVWDGPASVSAVAVDSAGGKVYVGTTGGKYDRVGATPTNGIAMWNGSEWAALAGGVSGESATSTAGVYSLAVDGTGKLYAGGEFMSVGGVPANDIARWDGTSWSALGQGISGSSPTSTAVFALALDGNDTLYVGGTFESAGGSPANSIAKWDGANWSALGSGVSASNATSTAVWSLAKASDGLYVGGYFDTAGGVPARSIAKWDGSSWSALGSGVAESNATTTTVYAVAGDGEGNVYVGGTFTEAGGLSANNIARWDGNNWSALGAGLAESNATSTVYAVAVDGPQKIYVAGEFDSAGGVPASNIAKWDGSSWAPLGSGVSRKNSTSSAVYALSVGNAGELVAGGNFDTAGDASANAVASWNGSAWSGLGGGIVRAFSAGVTSMVIDPSGNLYLGGYFAGVDETPARNIVMWNGTGWSALGEGIGYGGIPWGYIDSLTMDSAGNLYAGGYFDDAGGTPANGVAKWNGSSWSALGTGVTYEGRRRTYPGTVSALAVGNGNVLYAGGYFESAGGTPANGVAKWDGTSWSALGTGVEFQDVGLGDFGEVMALAFDSAGTLYAGGNFEVAGGVPAEGVARWNGSVWSPLGDGVGSSAGSPRVFALAVDTSDMLYAGGYFEEAGGTAANSIARWNGNSWAPLGSGITSTKGAARVAALIFDRDGGLYAGGRFDLAGDSPANSFAKWNGTSWEALGQGVSRYGALGWVDALALDAIGRLYIGGGFDTAGGKDSRSLALISAVVTPIPLTNGIGGVQGQELLTGEVRTFSFFLESLANVTLTSDVMAGMLAELLDGNNNLVASGSQVFGAQRQLSAGTYLLRLRNDGDVLDDLSLGVDASDTIDISIPLTNGLGTASGQQMIAGEVRRYKFSLEEPAKANFYLTGSSGLIAELLDGSGNVLADGSQVFDQERLMYPGDYFLRLRNPGNMSENFSITVDGSTTVASVPFVQTTTPSVISKKANPVSASALISNMGELPDSLKVSASPGNGLFKVIYTGTGGNITAALLSGNHDTGVIDKNSTPVSVRASVSPNKKQIIKKKGKKRITLKKRFTSLVRARSTSDPLLSSSVSITVSTR